MVAIQADLEKTRDLFKKRKVCQDVRSSVGWSEANELAWQKQLDSTRYGYVQWFGR